MINDFDVVIIGAGPAGCITALHLAHSGLKIAVIDKSVFPRDKICACGITWKAQRALKALPDDIYNDFFKLKALKESWGVKIYSSNSKSIIANFKNPCSENTRPFLYISQRKVFDNVLFKSLSKYKNIKTFEGFRVNDIFRDKNKIIVKTKDKNFYSNFVVGADGTNSVVSKKLAGFNNSKTPLCAVRAFYENISGIHADNYIEIFFIKKYLPAYFWIFPYSKTEANVGMALLTDRIVNKKCNLIKIFLKIIESHPLISPRFKNAKIKGSVQGFGLPLFIKKRNISGERFLLTGDAASLVDPLTGEGIGNAMYSGQIAAKHIIECFDKNDFSSNFMKNYNDIIYADLLKKFKISNVLKTYIKYPWIINLFVKKLNKYKEQGQEDVKIYKDEKFFIELENPLNFLKFLIK